MSSYKYTSVFIAFIISLVIGACGGGSNNACPSGVASEGQSGCTKDAIIAPGETSPAPLPTQGQAANTLGIGPLTLNGNGQLPSSSLSAATGCSTGLANSAAAAWNHVAVIVHEHTGYWLQSNGSASCYRTYQQQVELRNYWCSQGACQNAAVPGTSNHGWGLAVDAPPTTVSYIHAYSGGLFGQGYGSCSDAPWESWHIKYCGGYSGPNPGAYGSGGSGGNTGFPTLKHGSKGKRVQKLQTHLFYLHNAGTTNGYLVKWSDRTGYYGDHTQHAVHKLQHDGKLTSDGVYGAKTAKYQANRWKHFCNEHKNKKVCK